MAVLQGGEGRGRDDRGVVHLRVRVKHTLCVCVGAVFNEYLCTYLLYQLALTRLSVWLLSSAGLGALLICSLSACSVMSHSTTYSTAQVTEHSSLGPESITSMMIISRPVR